MLGRLFVVACMMAAIGWGALIVNQAVIAAIFILGALLAVFLLELTRAQRLRRLWADTEIDSMLD